MESKESNSISIIESCTKPSVMVFAAARMNDR